VFSYAVTSVRFLLVVVLGASAMGKLWNREALDELSRTLRTGLRLPMARSVSTGWVVIEGLTAVALIVPASLEYAAVLALVVLCCLTGGAAVLAAQHRGYACNCFGVGRSELGWPTVWRNGVLSVAAVFLAVAVRSPAGESAPAPVLLAAVLTVVIGAAMYSAARPLRILLAESRPARRATPPVSQKSAMSGGGR
jgi:Methylamine utilisation protein MauE